MCFNKQSNRSGYSRLFLLIMPRDKYSRIDFEPIFKLGQSFKFNFKSKESKVGKDPNPDKLEILDGIDLMSIHLDDLMMGNKIEYAECEVISTKINRDEK